jgi:sarcosine oxidase, subunit gamma
MADLLTRSHPLEPYLAALDALPDGLRITAEPFVALADLRVDPASGVRVRGAALPTTPNTWVAAGDGRLVWLGPDEWLVTSAGSAPEALEAELADVLRPVGGVAVDVSAQRIGLRITGARAREVLAKGCAIDLHPRAFGRGSSAQTTLGQAGVVLLALGDDGEDFAVLVRSSFAGYLATWLLDASLEYADPAPIP